MNKRVTKKREKVTHEQVMYKLQKREPLNAMEEIFIIRQADRYGWDWVFKTYKSFTSIFFFALRRVNRQLVRVINNTEYLETLESADEIKRFLDCRKRLDDSIRAFYGK